MLAAMFMAGAFLASPELRVYAANMIGSADIINNSILSVDIKDGEVKAADIATDAVGAAEIQGLTKLLFGECNPSAIVDASSIGPGSGIFFDCEINGVDADDSAIATYRPGNSCFEVASARALNPSSDDKGVEILLLNHCGTDQQIGSGARLAVMVYDK